MNLFFFCSADLFSSLICCQISKADEFKELNGSMMTTSPGVVAGVKPLTADWCYLKFVSCGMRSQVWGPQLTVVSVRTNLLLIISFFFIN